MIECQEVECIVGIDNLIRPGSEQNRRHLAKLGIQIVAGDIRVASDMEGLPPADWVIDAAANPSVLAGVDGKTSSRQLVEHNLVGTLNMLEYCRQHSAGFVLLSTSRVYSIAPLAKLDLTESDNAFQLSTNRPYPPGLSAAGVSEDFSIAPPVSLYGSTKIASEFLALEYGETFQFPVWINRCGVMAGAGSSVIPLKAFSLTGSIVFAKTRHLNTSDLVEADIKCVIASIRETLSHYF